MKRCILLLIAVSASVAAQARLGDDPETCARLYREWVRAPLFAQDRAFPTATGPGTTNLVYLHEPWRIRVGFIDGVAHRLEYSDAERPLRTITDEEVRQILNANGGTSKWRKITARDFKGSNPILEKIFSKPGSEAWLRRDGSIGQLRFNGSRFIVETYSILMREHAATAAAP